MRVNALVESRDAIVSARYSHRLRRFPGRFNLYKAVFHARGYRVHGEFLKLAFFVEFDSSVTEK